MERVTLRSGLTVDCTRHETVGDQVRLYTGRGKAYQEISFLQIVSIDYTPDSLAQAASKPGETNKPIVLPQPIVLAPAKAASVAAAPPVTSKLPTSKPPAVFAPAELPALSKPAGPPASAMTLPTPQPGFPEVQVHDLVQRAGSTYNIDAELLASIIHAESGYNARATSRGGARGLMQILPSVGRLYGANDLYRPEENVTAGTAFLDALLRRYNDNLALALAAYNAGPAAVERYHGVPPFVQTRTYVSRVMGEFYRRKLALGAKPGQPGVAGNAFHAPPPLQAVKPIQIGFTAPAAKPASRTRRAPGRSIHRTWSGQRSFPRSRGRGGSSYQGF